MKFYCPFCKCNLISTEEAKYSEADVDVDELGSPICFFGESSYRIIKCGKCDKIFFQTNSYDQMGMCYWSNSYPHYFTKKKFSENLSIISPTFIETYNQALDAKENNLHQLVGVSLRKSLEFLIKDFLAYICPDNADDIKKDPSLANVISNRIPLNKSYLHLDGLKALSLRAWWLGSDHTHYYVKYKDKDVDDLILCIDLAVSEIDTYLKKLNTIGSINKKASN